VEEISKGVEIFEEAITFWIRRRRSSEQCEWLAQLPLCQSHVCKFSSSAFFSLFWQLLRGRQIDSPDEVAGRLQLRFFQLAVAALLVCWSAGWLFGCWPFFGGSRATPIFETAQDGARKMGRNET
jgi:hypothetical protein